MDILKITGVKAFGYHGLLAEEHKNSQEFIVDVSLGTQTKKAGLSDNIQHSIDYVDIVSIIINHIEGKSVMLIEALAENISQNILKIFKPKFVEVTVHKPYAPVGYQFKDISLTIHRESNF